MRRIVLTVVLLLAVVAGAVWAYGESVGPGWWLRLRYPLEYENIVLGHAENYDLDPALIAAVIYRESGFDPDAVSEHYTSFDDDINLDFHLGATGKVSSNVHSARVANPNPLLHRALCAL